MKITSILFTCIIILSCSQKPDEKVSIAKNDPQPELPQPKKEEDPWIPMKELLEYMKNAPRIEHTPGIVSPFDTLDYNQIIAYKFWNSGERNPKVFGKHFLVREIEAQLALNQTQADKILRLLNKSSTYGGMRMACYEPRFGLVFYKDGRLVTQINICMECNYLESDVTIPVYEKQKEIGKTIPIEKFRAKHDYGFTAKGRKALVEFQTEIGFQKEE